MSNVLLGCAIGDALGVFAESKPPTYQPLLDWDGKTFIGSPHHGLLPCCYSDDTMFSTALAQSLINCNGFNPDDLSARYVEMFVNKTIRGYGTTTLLAINKLITGTHWSESGTTNSYGNGSIMRAPVFGSYFRNDLKSLIDAVNIDTKITHNSIEAIAGSLVGAIASFYATNQDTDNLLEKIIIHLPNSEVKNKIMKIHDMIENPLITPNMAFQFFGTKCDVRMTAPTILYGFIKFDNYQDACSTVIKMGGDTDTNSAIIGALYGSKYGKNHFSNYHVKNIEDSAKLIALDNQLYHRSNSNFLQG